VKQKSIKDIEKVPNKYLLKRVKFLTEKDFQVEIDANRLYQDFDPSLKKDLFFQEIYVNKINKRMDILLNKGFLFSNQPRMFHLSEKGQTEIKPFYSKIPWWNILIAFIGSIISIIINQLKK